MATQSNTRTAQPQGEGPSANLAALLTWFVPGAGHFYLGKLKTAAIAFGLIQGLYLLGVILSEGMFLQILPPEMRGRLAGALTPEAGNLGALLLHARQYGFGTGAPTELPSTIHIGVILTSAAGILNLILASSAHFEARTAARVGFVEPAPRPAFAALMGWLLPGAGHFIQGRKARGAVAFVAVVGLFFLGCVLADGTNLARTRHFYYWAGQALLGPVAFVSEMVTGHDLMTERVRYADAGVVIASVAGMLNVLLMLDVYGYSEAKLLGRPIASEDLDDESEDEGSEHAGDGAGTAAA